MTQQSSLRHQSRTPAKRHFLLSILRMARWPERFGSGVTRLSRCTCFPLRQSLFSLHGCLSTERRDTFLPVPFGAGAFVMLLLALMDRENTRILVSCYRVGHDLEHRVASGAAAIYSSILIGFEKRLTYGRLLGDCLLPQRSDFLVLGYTFPDMAATEIIPNETPNQKI